ncbi:Zn-dependent protease with chaperone function [Anaerovibrio sp. JC8]|uniref:M48 family metallopeptidase n=1 Tax=Anaerovibrio sp. JC8 TaxID=1240085 RepID=UPI000A0DA7BB|nr:M48 family metallopeptidase [Anaerovibrio sp. JC8]ORU00140.1 Zn-dependent protease with chaperone function [Anaerovibrio sp. JC8]
MFNFKKKLSKVIASAMLVAMPVFAGAPAQADANWLEAAINVGIAGYQMSEYNKQIDRINNTEEGRQQLYSQMKEKQGVENDPYLNQRLDGIMTNLSNSVAVTEPSINEKPFLYFINPSKDFNAACSLGHVMTVNAGIFDLLRTDDEVAVVLGHEMSHGMRDHVVKGFKKSVPVTLIATAIASNTNSVGIAVTNVIVNYTEKVHITKPMEWEADNIAFQYMADSHYNLGACAAVWQRVIEKYNSNQDKMTGDIFSVSDHPSHSERYNNYIQKMKEYSGNKVDVKGNAVYVNGKEFIVPAATEEMSEKVRACYVAGNLARAFHDNGGIDAIAYEGTVYMGNQGIITSLGTDASAEEIANKLNSIK